MDRQDFSLEGKEEGRASALQDFEEGTRSGGTVMSCAYLGEPVGKTKLGQPSYQCNKHRCHVVEGRGIRVVPGCSTCRDKLLLDDPEFLKRWQDPLDVIDRTRKRTEALRNMLAGGSVFLACSGPSANQLPLEELSRRGIWTMAVNNMAGHPKLRPQAFICSDPPSKFTHSIWLDPGIMKFVPTPKMTGSRANLKKKVGPGKFVLLGKKVYDCPNVWGFVRNTWMLPDESFFLVDGAPWGNQSAGVQRTGQPKTVNTMLLAMRLLKYLGAGRVFMIGVDFRMTGSYGYSFGQGIQHKKPKDPNKPARWDNDQYSVVNDWLCEMQRKKVFARFGIEFYNCFKNSSLRAFPHVPFETAMKDCKGMVEDVPDLSEWYEKLPLVK